MKFILIVLLVIVTGCNSYNSDVEENQNELKVNDLEESNKLLEEEIRLLVEESSLQEDVINALNEEVIKLKGEIQLLKESSIDLTEEQIRLIDFYNNFSISSVSNGSIDSGISITVECVEPLRIAPSEEAPYINHRSMTYTNYYEDTDTKSGEFLYVTNDHKGMIDAWCLVRIDDAVGYIKEEYVIEYSHILNDYPISEDFVDFEIGTTVDDLIDRFGDVVEINFMESRFEKSLYIDAKHFNSDEDESRIGVFGVFNPQNRVLEYITVGTSEIVLKSGFKVGDNASDVYEYYDERLETFLGDVKSYDIGNGYSLEFEELDGVIIQITINHGYILSH